MRMEFQKGLANRSDLSGIRGLLISHADAHHRQVLKSIERDFLTAQLIVAGLEEPPTSEAYRIARGFLDDFERGGAPKKKPEDDEVLRLLKGETELTIDGGEEDGTAEESGKAE